MKIKIILFIMIVVSFVSIYKGCFFFEDENEIKIELEKQPEEIKDTIIYNNIEKSINNNRQVINILEIDISHNDIEIKPMLSHNSIFGFEKLSDMAIRNEAYAAINGGFFYEYGDPSGMIIIDNELITKSTGKYPVFFKHNGNAKISEVITNIWIEHNGEKIEIDGINSYAQRGKSYIYTRRFGIGNRVNTENLSIVVENDVVKEIITLANETKIPRNGFVITFIPPYYFEQGEIPFKIGDTISWNYKTNLGNFEQAYECGSWLIRDGQIVVPDWDEWVGVLTNRDPRTVVGIKDNGNIILLTVDGRQPGYSIGLTGKELASLLLDLEVRDAAMLDGGASTGMVIEGNVVNRPSFGGNERLLGGGLGVMKGNN